MRAPQLSLARILHAVPREEFDALYNDRWHFRREVFESDKRALESPMDMAYLGMVYHLEYSSDPQGFLVTLADQGILSKRTLFINHPSSRGLPADDTIRPAEILMVLPADGEMEGRFNVWGRSQGRHYRHAAIIREDYLRSLWDLLGNYVQERFHRLEGSRVTRPEPEVKSMVYVVHTDEYLKFYRHAMTAGLAKVKVDEHLMNNTLMVRGATDKAYMGFVDEVNITNRPKGQLLTLINRYMHNHFFLGWQESGRHLFEGERNLFRHEIAFFLPESQYNGGNSFDDPKVRKFTLDTGEVIYPTFRKMRRLLREGEVEKEAHALEQTTWMLFKSLQERRYRAFNIIPHFEAE
ncbi:MAG: hypothetical protein KJ709_04520 [Nanoarchaeota archaeon]|nr:hypothetical protein [Nanoarchaeota archaeon]